MALQPPDTDKRFRRLEDRASEFSGWMLEQKYIRHAYAYFGTLLLKIEVVSLNELEDTLERELLMDEQKEIHRLDLIVKGQARTEPPNELYLAVEISTTIDKTDVERAVRRAGLLRKAGYLCIPVVGGEKVT